MNAEQLADKYEIIYADRLLDNFVRFSRQSPCFGVGQNYFIDQRPLYDTGNHKVTDVFLYMMSFVYQALENDLKRQACNKLRILKIRQLDNGCFYYLDYPLVVWEIKTDCMDMVINGHIWVDKSTVIP